MAEATGCPDSFCAPTQVRIRWLECSQRRRGRLSQWSGAPSPVPEARAPAPHLTAKGAAKTSHLLPTFCPLSAVASVDIFPPPPPIRHPVITHCIGRSLHWPSSLQR